MRVGVDAHPLREPLTGVGRYLFELLERFPSDVELVLYSRHPPLLPPAVRPGDATIRTYPRGQWAFSLQSRVAADASKDGLDVFWAPNAIAPLSVRVPTVITVHDLTVRLHGSTMRRRRRLLESLMLRQSVRKAQKIMTVSETTASLVSTFYPNAAQKVRTTRIDGATLPPSEKDLTRGDFILAVGTIEPRKNIMVLLAAIERLLVSGTHASIVLVGNYGWHAEECMGRLEDLRARFPSSIEVMFDADDKRLAELYRTCRAFVAGSIYEGFGMPVVEAMREGAPVIVSDIAAFREVGGEAPLYFAPDDHQTLASHIRRLLTDQTECDRRSRLSIDQAARFSWADTASQTISVLADAA